MIRLGVEISAVRERTFLSWLCNLVLVLVLFTHQVVSAQTTYYVDAINGSDANLGSSTGKAWQSALRVQSQALLPGDTVLFKRGSVFPSTNEFTISRSGTKSRPIVYASYGIGNRPAFRNISNNIHANGIGIYTNWIVLDGLAVDTAGNGGIEIGVGATNNIVRNCELTRVGIGISVDGDHNLIMNNYVHYPLHMVVNTPFPTNDDYGAEGIALRNSHNEICYNRLDSCYASSYDYGEDGEAFEVFGIVDSCYIHHNWVKNCYGLLEAGGGSSSGLLLAYNVYVNTRGQGMMMLHLGGSYQSTIQNFRFENNTVLCQSPTFVNWAILDISGSPSSATFAMRNNIFYCRNWAQLSNKSAITHGNNLFFSADTQFRVGLPLNPGEIIGDPMFANLKTNDLHLKAGSPAIGAGLILGYTYDIDNLVVPIDRAPSLGAFEHPSGLGGLFEASPDSLLLPGKVTLSWNLPGAQSIWIDHGVGYVEPVGSRVVTVNGSTDFLLTGSSSSVNFSLVTRVAFIASSLGYQSNHPTIFSLYQNFPNPFNPSTLILYEVPRNEFVTIELYDVLGRLVKTLVDEQKEMGSYEVALNAGAFASGVYYYRMQAGQFVATRKCLLLK